MTQGEIKEVVDEVLAQTKAPVLLTKQRITIALLAPNPMMQGGAFGQAWWGACTIVEVVRFRSYGSLAFRCHGRGRVSLRFHCCNDTGAKPACDMVWGSHAKAEMLRDGM